MLLFSFFTMFSMTFSLDFQVQGKRGEILWQKQNSIFPPKTVGEITIHMFETYQIPYAGSEEGIASIYNVSSDITVISDEEMKAYGWCFSVNGEILETMPNESIIFNNEAQIKWFYGYAHYLRGEWVQQCAVDK